MILKKFFNGNPAVGIELWAISYGPYYIICAIKVRVTQGTLVVAVQASTLGCRVYGIMHSGFYVGD